MEDDDDETRSLTYHRHENTTSTHEYDTQI